VNLDTVRSSLLSSSSSRRPSFPSPSRLPSFPLPHPPPLDSMNVC
jgi:hypothetical protein